MVNVAPQLRDTLARGFRSGVKPRYKSGVGPDAGTGQGVKARMWKGPFNNLRLS